MNCYCFGSREVWFLCDVLGKSHLLYYLWQCHHNAPVIFNHGRYGAGECQAQGYWLFSLQCPAICPALPCYFLCSKPYQKPCSDVKLPNQVWAWNWKLRISKAQCGRCWVLTWHLSPTMSPLSQDPWGPGLQMTGALLSQLIVQNTRSKVYQPFLLEKIGIRHYIY